MVGQRKKYITLKFNFCYLQFTQKNLFIGLKTEETPILCCICYLKIISMKSFVKNYIKQFDNCKEVPVHFVGSIAFYLKDELQETFDKYELKLGNVLRRPIDGLIAYHVANQ